MRTDLRSVPAPRVTVERSGSPRWWRGASPLTLAALGLVAVLAGCGSVTDPSAADAAVTLAPRGTSCDSDAECASGACVDHVCCDSRCEGECSRCDLEDARGTCTPVPAATECGVAACDEGQLTPAPRCDGNGACVASPPTSCGAYVCDGERACFAACTPGSDAACSSGNVCAGGVCAPPSCADGVRSPPETGVDCGGGACPRCGPGQGCQVGTDCESGTCASGACTTPTYAWRTSAFGSCGAGACSVGTQTRTVWCERSDGTTVADGLCAGTRPAESQTCNNTNGCTWYAGNYGTCSARCGGGTQTRPVYCRDGAGAQVPSSWCTGAPPTATASCNTFPCVVHVVGEPTAQMGPCWSPPSCLGGYPAFPSCPAGYAPTRSETACGNPNNCGSNWALCVFYQTVHYGCSDPSYVMGVAARECTYQ